jgi:penicillin-binding protein 2
MSHDARLHYDVDWHEVDWHELADEQRGDAPASSPRHRLRWLLACYAVGLLIVLARAVQLELSGGAEFRDLASRPVERLVPLAAERGRILARDGTVLAADREARALAIHYRYLQSPPNERWLRRQARARLSRAERRDSAAVTAAQEALRVELRGLHRRLAAMCGVSESQWSKRTARIQRRVEQLAESINRRRLEKFVEQTSTVPEDETQGVVGILTGMFAPPERLPPAEVTVAEEIAYHRVVDELPPHAAQSIADLPAAFPGVKVIVYTRRNYPHASLASNVVGHVGTASSARATLVAEETATEATETIGLLGIESRFESELSGVAGRELRYTDRRGELLETRVDQKAIPGRDVVLTIDVELQRFAEQLLDRFARHQGLQDEAHEAEEQGGAVLVMDVRSGEILSAASEPRFDPNWFATGDPRVEAVLAAQGRPLFDRATRMAIPPGSVFKPLTAMALLEHGVVRADTPFACQGYLDDPERMRCQIFRQHGIGHGDVTLADALAQSCNVYFFHHARALGPNALLAWSQRLGFGRTMGSDIGQLTAGHVPTANELEQRLAVESFSIGQGTLTATPLEVLGMYAAIANGGYLLEPKFTRAASAKALPLAAAATLSIERRIAGLDDATLAAVRAGLERVVEDPAGTAFATVRMADFPIAGKTGTAETGGGQPDHAWFAGYAPANAPQVAFVVVLEHGGSGSTAAGTIAKNLVQRMRQLGYFGEAQTAEKAFPPGKG